MNEFRIAVTHAEDLDTDGTTLDGFEEEDEDEDEDSEDEEKEEETAV